MAKVQATAVKARPAPGKPSPVGGDFRSERDRFVAFAFASADAFLELDRDHNILYAVGAVQWLAGKTPQALLGESLIDYVSRSDQALMRAALGSGGKQGRFGPLNVRFDRGDGRALSIAVFGSHLPTHAGRTFLALSANRTAAAAKVDQTKIDTDTGLLNKDAFADIAAEALKAGKEQGHDYVMTLLDLDGLAKMRGKLGAEDAEAFVSEIMADLQASSVNGASAGHLDGDKFGLVHEAELDVTSLEKRIATRAKEADPDGAGLKVEAAKIDLEASGGTDADEAKALLYTINKFSESRGDFTISELNQGYKLMMKETKGKIRAFKDVITQGAFDVLFQPIVELKTRFVHHYEALSRLRMSCPDASPYQFITFAEEVGIIGEFDLAVCKKVIQKINKAREHGDIISIAVNLSGKSLENPQIIDELHKMLRACRAIREDLLFEVTESAKISDLESTNNVIQGLRKLGHHVCLDDFGAGAAAFQYLRALDIDYVKIDGVYVREALTTRNGKAFLRSMANLCRDIGVQTVAEMIEDEEQAEFLIDADVRYGQGYLFGKPGVGVASTHQKQAS
jgi:EAL domain-containing protein (putative c-di-GMP-specific phosphodiesterase class I)/GGDEF domain-containing protein